MRSAPPLFRDLCTGLLLAAAGCGADRAAGGRSAQPDVNPVMRNAEPPFRYPAALYDLQVQGNVTLRLFVDETGTVVPESTSVNESSSYAALDSAAIIGSESLRFAPAQRDGKPIAVSILFPVYFRHPAAKPLPGDTVLQGPEGQQGGLPSPGPGGPPR
jgi:protein TonB